jgi:hypothetical protein
MDIKVLRVAGDSNINAAADAAVEEIKQNMFFIGTVVFYPKLCNNMF